MGRELYESDAALRRRLRRGLRAARPTPGASRSRSCSSPRARRRQLSCEDTTYAQPALFAIEVALYEALPSCGLKPDLLAGHSIGEIAAAHVAGVLDLDDAAKLVGARGTPDGRAARGRRDGWRSRPPRRRQRSRSRARRRALDRRDQRPDLDRDLRRRRRRSRRSAPTGRTRARRTKRLAVSHAFHSPLIEPMLEEFAEVAEASPTASPRSRSSPTVTGELLDPEQATDPAYWVRHVREAVRFADAVATLQEPGRHHLPRARPRPGALRDGARDPRRGRPGRLRPDPARGPRGAQARSPLALAAAHAAGAKLDWGAFFEGTGAKRGPAAHLPLPARALLARCRRRRRRPERDRPGDAEHPLLAAVARGPRRRGPRPHRPPLARNPPLAGRPRRRRQRSCCPAPPSSSWPCRAGERGRRRAVEELTLQAPLDPPEAGAVALQVAVAGPTARTASARSRSTPAPRREQTEPGVDPERQRRRSPSDQPERRRAAAGPGRPREPSRSRSTTSTTASPRPASSTAPPSRG